MANSVDPDQTAPIGAVCSESTLFASILNSSLKLVYYLQQTTSADNIFRCIFFLGASRVNQVQKLALHFSKFSRVSLRLQGSCFSHNSGIFILAKCRVIKF